LEDILIGWKDNITLDCRETGREDVDCIHMAQDKRSIAGSCEHGNKPLHSIKCGEFNSVTISFLRTLLHGSS